jgi:hypothetical protein
MKSASDSFKSPGKHCVCKSNVTVGAMFVGTGANSTPFFGIQSPMRARASAEDASAAPPHNTTAVAPNTIFVRRPIAANVVGRSPPPSTPPCAIKGDRSSRAFDVRIFIAGRLALNGAAQSAATATQLRNDDAS